MNLYPPFKNTKCNAMDNKKKRILNEFYPPCKNTKCNASLMILLHSNLSLLRILKVRQHILFERHWLTKKNVNNSVKYGLI